MAATFPAFSLWLADLRPAITSFPPLYIFAGLPSSPECNDPDGDHVPRGAEVSVPIFQSAYNADRRESRGSRGRGVAVGKEGVRQPLTWIPVWQQRAAEEDSRPGEEGEEEHRRIGSKIAARNRVEPGHGTGTPSCCWLSAKP
ncbi:hypothetical protein HPB47_020215 [Ixodes persulcatus]|uniref:Uncharacterized protein n=1 Tax=Ixodes persulcatus TaxID=34615 RepID=A0AC60QH03_IXOPE|nr:hypothetical protein HPB47_020215 [Ixodes persulcatus]